MSTNFTRTARTRVAGSAAFVLVCAGVQLLGGSLVQPASAAPGATHLVSRAAAASTQPSLSPDGRHVAFASKAPLAASDTNPGSDVYLATATGTPPYSGRPVLVSAGAGGAAANGDSTDPAVSGDGHYVAFTSTASNLVAGDTNARADVFLRDAFTLTTTRLAEDATDPVIDASGRRVAYVSGGEVVLLDRDTGARTNVSAAQDAPASDPAISGDGRYVSFTTTSGDGSRGWRWSAAQGAQVLGSGNDADRIGQTSLSHDGVVAYVSSQTTHQGYAGNGLPAGPKVFVEWPGGHWEWVSDGLSSVPSDPVVSGDGAWVAFVAGGAVRLAETESRYGTTTTGADGQPAPVVGPATGSEPAISAAGRAVALTTTSPVGTDTDMQPDVAVAETAETLDQALHPRLDTIDGIAVPAPVRHVDPGDIPSDAFYGVDPGLADAARSTIARSTIARSTIARSTIARSTIARSTIARSTIARSTIARSTIARSTIARSTIARSTIGTLPLSRFPLTTPEGGWTTLLKGTPFEGVPLQAVTLKQVHDWAVANPGHEQAAAILGIRIADFGPGSAFGEISLVSFLMLAVPVSQLRLPDATATSNLGAWQDAVAAQGFPRTLVTSGTLVIELQQAGVDLSATTIGLLPASEIPVADSALPFISLAGLDLRTPIGLVRVSDLANPSAVLDCSGGCPTGTLRENADRVRADGTLADLVTGLPAWVSVAEVLRALTLPEAFAWEDLNWSAIGPGRFTEPPHSQLGLSYRAGFDTGVGGDAFVRDAKLDVQLPAGTAFADASFSAVGPREFVAPYKFRPDGSSEGVEDFGNHVVFHLGDVPSGTTLTVDVTVTDTVDYDQARPLTGVLTSSTGSDEARITLTKPAGWQALVDPPANDQPGTAPRLDTPNRIYFGDISRVEDADYVKIPRPPYGKRLVVAMGAVGGDADLGVFQATGEDPAPPTGTTSGDYVGSTPLLDQGRRGRLQPAPINILDQRGYTLLDGSTHTGTDSEQVEVPGTIAGGGDLLVKVASAGRASTLPYTLRYLYVDEPTEQKCPAYQPKNALAPELSLMPLTVPADTNTVFLVDPRRMTQDYGLLPGLDLQAGVLVTNLLTGLDGQYGVKAITIPITGIDLTGTHNVPAVQAARARLDQNPCSVTASNALARAIADQLATFDLPNLKHVVLVGGDDVIPFFRQPQATFEVVESWNEPMLRLGTRNPAACATGLGAPWDALPCDGHATAVSAAAHSNMILTDDPYGDRSPVKVLDRHLSVPDVALGRLGESPTEIKAAVDTFLQAQGVVKADTSLLAGYDAWNELPAALTSALGKRVQGRNTQLTGSWTKQQMMAALFPAGTSPNIVSLNAHASETDLLPAVPGASADIYASGDLVDARELQSRKDRLKAAILFTIGCHAGGPLPDMVYGTGAVDWAQALGVSGGYIANTGYGIADTAATGLSERLAELYAKALTRGLTAGEALSAAKHEYAASMGQYLGYDEKILMQTTYYGLPMYRVQAVSGAQPAPSVKRSTTWSAESTNSGLSVRTATVSPTHSTQTLPDGSGYLTSGEGPQVSAGLPLLSKMTLGIAPVTGKSARGALITGMSSTWAGPTKVAIADTSYGDRSGPGRYDDIAYPASLAHVTTEQSLVLITDRVDANSTGTATEGATEKITRQDVTAYFSGSSDRTPPSLRTTQKRSGGSVTFTVAADDNGPSGSTRRAIVLLQVEGTSEWVRHEMGRVSGDTWSVTIPDPGVFRAFTQVVDQSGLVGIDMNRGHFLKGSMVAPTFNVPGTVTIAEGTRWFEEFAITDPDSDRFTGRIDFGFGPQEIQIDEGPDGLERGLLELFGSYPGSTPVSLEVCDDSGLCTTLTFILVVEPANTAPQSTVTLSSGLPRLGDTLTATGNATDADDDPVTLTYRWWINDQLVPGATGTTFVLDDRVAMGDTVTVTVTPNDGFVDGGGSSASAVVRVTGPPVVDAGADATATEGTPWQQVGTWEDADGDAITAATVDYGDGAGPKPLVVDPDGTFSLQHTYADSGTFTVTVALTDSSGQTTTDTLTVTVQNAAPEITSTGTDTSVNAGQPVALTVAWTDPGADTHTVAVDWGDGTASSCPVAPGARTASCTHTYTAPGTYTVTITVTDDEGAADTVASYQQVTVHLNTAGSMVSNGHFTSPPGAWSVAPDSSAQAEYGGNVKSNGATPTGKVHLTYDITPLDRGCEPASCLAMDSTKLLTFGVRTVPEGKLAILRGQASVNGTPGYTFLWVALDGSPDRVRIRVTSPSGEVVYDSQRGAPDTAVPTVVDTDGSVVIR